MIIRCDDLDMMLETIAGLVSRGLTFEADAAIFTITLTGGY